MEAESAAATATGGAAVVLPDTSGMDAIAHPGKVMDTLFAAHLAAGKDPRAFDGAGLVAAGVDASKVGHISFATCQHWFFLVHVHFFVGRVRFAVAYVAARVAPAQVLSLNDVPAEKIPSGSLVRYRCTIQVCFSHWLKPSKGMRRFV